MRHRRTRDVVIELTSLLDIVMILIFAVLIDNSKLVEAEQTKLKVANEQLQTMQGEMEQLDGLSEKLKNALAKLSEGEVEELLAQLQNAENRLDTYDYMKDLVLVINIGLENRYSNTSRCLTFGTGSQEGEYESYEVGRDDREEWNYGINKLKLYLSEYTKQISEEDDTTVYIIFSVDTSKVYSNDFNAIEKVLQEIVAKDSTGKIQYRINYLNQNGG